MRLPGWEYRALYQQNTDLTAERDALLLRLKAESGDDRSAVAAVPLATADAEFVLRWLKQSGAPTNIIALQTRAYDALAGIPDEHILELGPNGYGLQHPLRCRPNLLDCPYEHAARELAGDEAEHGRWIVELHPDGVLEFVEAAAGVSGGTPPSEPEDERPGDAHKADSPVQASGSLGGDTEADLGGDGGPVAVDTAPFYPGRAGCVCDMRGELDDGECAYFSDPCWVDRAAYERSLRSGSGTPTGSARLPEPGSDSRWTAAAAVAWISARPGDLDADAIIRDLAGQLIELQALVASDDPVAALARERLHAHKQRERLERSVGRLEEALRVVIEWPVPQGTVETYVLPRRLAAQARAALAGGTPPDTTGKDSGDSGAVVAEPGQPSGDSA